MAILLNGVSFVVSAVAISAIPAGPAFRPAVRGNDVRPSILSEIKIGARALRAAPDAVRLIAADLLCSTIYGFCSVTLVLVSRRVGAGEGGYGLLLGAFGAGGVIGAIVTARFDRPSQWRRMLASALTLVALPLVALGLVHALALAVLFALLGGAGSIVAEVLSETALPRLVDDEVLARAYGLALPMSLSGIVVGSLIGGPLVACVGLTTALVLAAIFVALVAVILVRRPWVHPVTAGTARVPAVDVAS
jgi:predicted MFS family arabinose efflux permease